jgi:hypothetical protein
LILLICRILLRMNISIKCFILTFRNWSLNLVRLILSDHAPINICNILSLFIRGYIYSEFIKHWIILIHLINSWSLCIIFHDLLYVTWLRSLRSFLILFRILLLLRSFFIIFRLWRHSLLSTTNYSLSVSDIMCLRNSIFWLPVSSNIFIKVVCSFWSFAKNHILISKFIHIICITILMLCF